ncbi:NADPH:quinone reductase [Pseudonocardia ailaonensis]|uniref:NADPH:quinone reductase n=1 Tax=Pseudonocardia ailaonensis TaxID=367279 RepID=A0ABN2MSI5_9PSEU
MSEPRTMGAMVYGPGPDIREVRRPVPEPADGEVRVRIGVGGINPADWRNRRRYTGDEPVVPLQDGAGVVDAVGPGVDATRVGERVWLWETARQRSGGCAQKLVVVPADRAVPLPADVGLDVGAGLGVPAVTAHRCLTVGEGGPERLAPKALDGRTVLVAGGAGAVGHAAIQLARWSGATVIATVSTADKAALAEAAGAHHVVRYRDGDAGEVVRGLAPDGVDLVVELAPDQNTELDLRVLAPGGTIAVYAGGAAAFPVDLGSSLGANARWQFVSIFTMAARAKEAAIAAVTEAVAAGVLGVGPEAGLPVHHYPLADLGRAFEAVEQGAVGKVLVDVGPELG